MLRLGHAIILCALALLTIGVVMVQSAGMQVAPLGVSGETHIDAVSAESLLTSTTAQHLVIALVALGVASFIPVRRIAHRIETRTWLPPAGDLGVLVLGSLLLAGVIITVYIPGIARPRYGAHRWIDLRVPGFTSMQPSEVAKWGIVLLVAVYAARLGSEAGKGLTKLWSGLVPACACIGFVAFVVVLEDLGTGVLMVGACSVVLLAAGARVWHFALFAPPALAGIALAIVTSPYRVDRIMSFLHPYADPQGEGYQMIQSLTTIAGGGFFGRGLGNGLQKFGYLPEDTTDFLFAVICEEMGFVGALIVVCLYAGILWAGLDIAKREPSRLLRLVVLGIIATISIQALMNLMVVTGLGPTKGIALPLLSSGGTGWLFTSACLGLIVAIDRTRERALAPDPFDIIEQREHELIVRSTTPSAAPDRPRALLSES